MTEIEVPIEKIQEDISEVAEKAHESGHGGGGHGPSWIVWSALISAFLAVFAAVSALMAGHYANEAMVEQIQSSDHWAYYQAKSIKAAIVESRHEILKSLGKPVADESVDKLQHYRDDQKNIQEEAEAKQKESLEHLHKHEVLAKSVTLFQVAIALTAVAVLARRKVFLAVSGLFGLGGIFFLLQAFLFF
jgi:hypothetical protein